MLKVAQLGCGKMSKYTMRYVYEKGGCIVAALDINEAVIGKDIGTIIECEDKGVVVSALANAEEVLKAAKPDVCIITTMSLLSDVYEAYKLCAKLGINAISTCEEAFYPMNSNPNITKELDELAKANNCTLTGSGYQDVYWGNLIATIAGSTHKITKIKGSSSYNVEDYGIALAKAHGAGLSLKDFDNEIASADRISKEERDTVINSGEFLPSYMWTASYWIAERLGLTVTSQRQVTVPMTNDKDLKSSTLNMDIKAGDATGMSAIVTALTKEGIEIEAECIGKVYNETEFDKNEWTIYGEPTTTVVINKPCTVELTCATIVNRLEDVIASKPGYVTTDNFKTCEYIANSFKA